jgi:hypothetical protein
VFAAYGTCIAAAYRGSTPASPPAARPLCRNVRFERYQHPVGYKFSGLTSCCMRSWHARLAPCRTSIPQSDSRPVILDARQRVTQIPEDNLLTGDAGADLRG